MVQPAVPDARPGRAAIDVLVVAARAVHAQRDRQSLLHWLAEATCQGTGAAAAGVCLYQPDGGVAWTATGAPDVRVLGDPRSHHPLLPAAQGDAVVVTEDAAADWGGTAFTFYLPDAIAALVIPILRGDGTPYGVLLAVGDGGTNFTGEAVDVSRGLAEHLGTALDNLRELETLAELRNLQGELVDRLQEAVRPPLPVVPHTELGVWYVAAEEGVPTGGDLWDWVVLPDGSLHFVVVDVMGKGVAATKDALAIVHAIRMLVLEGCPVGDIVRRVDALLGPQDPDLVATMVVGRYEPETGRVLLAGAGHPPPFLTSQGAVREIPVRGIPLGWPGAGSEAPIEVQLGRWDTLVLYTDGLVEAGKDIVAGLETLSRYAVETARYPAEHQARVLIERVLHRATRRDDALALVIRRRTPPDRVVMPLGPFQHRLAATTAAVPTARRLLADWLRAVPVEAGSIDELLLITSELCANAVEHATWETDGVTLRAWSEGPDVVLEVEDDGGGMHWPTLRPDELPDPHAEQGRGLWLVHALADEVVPVIADGRTRVRVVKRAVSPTAG